MNNESHNSVSSNSFNLQNALCVPGCIHFTGFNKKKAGSYLLNGGHLQHTTITVVCTGRTYFERNITQVVYVDDNAIFIIPQYTPIISVVILRFCKYHLCRLLLYFSLYFLWRTAFKLVIQVTNLAQKNMTTVELLSLFYGSFNKIVCSFDQLSFQTTFYPKR